MSVCYGCATSFGVFNKQLGCKNCGFAFCKKCLVKKTCVPKQNNEKAAVCNKCFDLLTGKIQPVNIEPPAAYTKRVLAASQTQQDHPAAPQNTAVHCSKQTKGLSTEDAALAKRLEDLKKDRKAVASIPSQAEIESRMSKLREERNAKVPSDREMAERLAVVRGQDPNRATQPSVLKPENRKMHQEQVDDLLSEICQEVEIDSHGFNYTTKKSAPGSSDETNDLNKGELFPKVEGCATYNIGAPATHTEGVAGNTNQSDIDRMVREVAAEMEIDAKKAMEDLSKDKELWNRVQRLKADRKTAAESDLNETKAEGYSAPESDEENEEEATKRLIQQLLEENRLEESGIHSQDQSHSKSSKATKPNDDSEMETDELPWCCICNNDAVLRCRGCDGDLYCQRCYREGHNRYDKEEHPTIPYKKN